MDKNNKEIVGTVSFFDILGLLVQVKDPSIREELKKSVDNLTKQINNVDTTLNRLLPKLPTKEGSMFVTVGKNGAMYQSINAALTYILSKSISLNNPATIFIYPGVYNEQIVLDDFHGISFIGCGVENTIIQSSGSYPDCTLHVQGDYSFYNMTIINTNPSTYAVHSDPVDKLTSGLVEFRNCHIKGGSNAIGYGAGNNTELRISNCVLEASNSPIYAHNCAYGGRSGQKLTLLNNLFYDNSEHMALLLDDAGYTNGGQVSQMVCTIHGNVSNYAGFTQMQFRKATGSPSTFTSYLPINDSNIICSAKCSDNGNIPGMNFGQGKYDISTYLLMPPNKSYDGKYRASIPINVYYANYNTTLNNVTIPGIGDVTSTFSIDSQSNEHFIFLISENDNIAGRSVSVSISMIVR